MDRATIWPTALAALLGVIVLAELLAPGEASPPVPPPRQNAAAAPAQGDISSLAAAWSDSILARPIFRPDRRPLQAPAAAPAAMPKLTAIVITASGASAIFVDDDGTAVGVKVGGLVDGQAVKSITAGGVTLAGPAGVIMLRPQFGPPDGAPPSPPAAGTAPNPVLPFALNPNNVNRY